MRWLGIVLLGGLVLAACGQGEDPRSSDSASESASEQLYSCGMHPHVLEDEPGQCPICSMDLTPVMGPAQGASGERKVKHWVAPMDPSYVSDRPGKSPMGMDLVPVYEDAATGFSGLTIDPVVVQNMGVRTEIARRQTVFRHVGALGQVEVGEDQVSVVNLRFSAGSRRFTSTRRGIPWRRGSRSSRSTRPTWWPRRRSTCWRCAPRAPRARWLGRHAASSSSGGWPVRRST